VVRDLDKKEQFGKQKQSFQPEMSDARRNAKRSRATPSGLQRGTTVNLGRQEDFLIRKREVTVTLGEISNSTT